MKKHIVLILTALVATLSCTRFDDSAIWEGLLNHRERIEKLEAQCNRLNANIEGIQVLLEALQAKAVPSQNSYRSFGRAVRCISE